MSSNIFFSPSKINLYLEILSKSENGLHNLNSLMTFTDIGDHIEINVSKEFFFKTKGPFSDQLGDMKKNIIFIALKKLESLINKKLNVEIILTKNLPLGSGLGGGSSNAATVVKALIKIYKLNVDQRDLDSLLISIGSDVPFCFHGRTAILNGIGDKLLFVSKLKEYDLLLVNPLVEVSTKKIFEKVEKFNDKPTIYNNLSFDDSILKTISKSSNDLENIAVKVYPEIGSILTIFKKTNSIFTRMSGSGGTCFGLFNSKKDLLEAESIFHLKNKNWWIKKGKILNYI